MGRPQEDEDDIQTAEDAPQDQEPQDSAAEESTEEEEGPAEEGGKDEPSEEESAEDVGEEKPADSPPAVAASGEPTPAEKQQAMKDYLSQKYDKASSREGIEEAREKSRRKHKIANIGSGLTDMAMSRGVANGLDSKEGKVWQSLRNEGNQGVAQAETDRQQSINDFVSKNQMARQSDQDAQKNALAKQTLDQADPDSRESQVARSAFKANFPDVASAMGDDFNQMTPKDLGRISQMTDTKAKIDSAKEIARTRAQAHTDAVAARASASSSAASGKADLKATADHNKNYIEMFKRGEGGKGAPQNFTKAQVALTSVKNAQELLNSAPKGPDGQPDYNKLSPQQVHLLNGELEKLATNGSPTIGGRAAQDAGTFAQKWAELKNKAVGPDGEVGGANLGPFIKQSANYIQGLGKVSNDVVNTYRRSNFDAYAKTNMISEEHKAIYKEQHPELFPEEQKKDASAATAPAEDKQAAVAPAATHPEANAALAWAKANPNDPRAAEIMKRLGSNNAGL